MKIARLSEFVCGGLMVVGGLYILYSFVCGCLMVVGGLYILYSVTHLPYPLFVERFSSNVHQDYLNWFSNKRMILN